MTDDEAKARIPHDPETCKQCAHEHDLLQLLLKKHEHYTAPREQLVIHPNTPRIEELLKAIREELDER